MKKVIFILFIFASFLISSDFSFKNLIKTNREIKIEDYLKDIDTLLLKFYEKLNKRNPSNFDKRNEKAIKEALLKSKYIVVKNYEHNPVEIVKLSLDRDKKVAFRNDYLIIGIHDMIYKVFKRDDFKVTALSYDADKLNRLFLNLQIIFWQIGNYRDRDGNYLFLTWQSNWQIELQKALKAGIPLKKAIVSLPSLKSGRESLLEPCNMSFSMIYAKILYIVEKIIKESGGEPQEIGVSVLKSLALSPLL